MNVYLGELYKEVQYIQSDGNQIIDTGVYGNGNTSILTKMVVAGRKEKYDMYYGAYGDSGISAFFIQSNYPDNNKIRVVNYSNDASTRKYVDSINNLQFNTEYIIQHTNTNFLINGTLQGTMASSSFTTNYTLCMFGIHDKHGRLNPQLIGKIYYFKIYESGTLVRDFIPCYRVSDNVIGLFDKVNNKFYTNAGTGSFTKGADVKTFQPELKNAYIGEYKGWTPGENTLVYYPLNGNANDYSGNGKNGTASNVAWNSGGDGGCARFNGSNSYITVPSLSINNSLTISCWIKTTQSSEGEIIQMLNSSTTQSLELRVRLGKLYTEVWNDGYVSDKVYSSSSVNNGQRVNIVLTKIGTSYNMYINGSNDGSMTSSFGTSYSVNKIGMHFNGQAQYGGLIDNFIIENKARTSQEIQDYYNNTKSLYGL